MAPSLRDLVSYATNFVAQLPILNSNIHHVSPYEPLSGAPSCPLDGPTSCHNTTPVVGDSCCFVHPGGRMVLAQLWDEEVHAPGAEEDWTLHGLWPELCDGSDNSHCIMAPHYTNITAILRHYGQDDLLEFMHRYWVTESGPYTPPWQSLYKTHATCINTLSPTCYRAGLYTPGIEIIDYLTRAAALFRTLDTYLALFRAHIVPDATRNYPLADVRRALQQFTGGGRVELRCSGPGRNMLREVRYVFFVRGSFQTGQFVPAPAVAEELEEEEGDEDRGGCASVVRYLPKRGRRGWFSL